MRVDKEKLAKLLEKNDEELWADVVRMASEKGFELPKAPPPKAEMDKMRSAVSGGGVMDLARAAKILNDYRKGVK